MGSSSSPQKNKKEGRFPAEKMIKKILCVDTREEIIQDLEANFALYSINSRFDLKCISDLSLLEAAIDSFEPDRLVLGGVVVKEKDSWDIDGVEVVFYARTSEELAENANCGLLTIGIAKTTFELIKKLDKENPYSPAKKEKGDSAKSFVKETGEKKEQKKTKDSVMSKVENETKNKKAEPERNERVFDKQEELEVLEEDDEYDFGWLDETEDPKGYDKENAREEEPVVTKNPQTKPTRKEDILEEVDIIKRGFEKDLRGNNGNTKVVTVYSAKGGVGKTTISTELAEYLALVQNGRKKMKVAIIDYNIDFGDVRSTLSADPDGQNLTYWAEEVQELLESGTRADKIFYSEKEIEEKMQRDEKSGLYILPAPLTNEDSMGIESEALAVIMENVIQNGGFDIVVCDTGNNTRDSTMIALEKADIILLIMTQSVNTANCDRAFMNTMESIDFDLSKTKLVINNIMPQKSTKISVQEIMDCFPYECIGKVKFDTDVIAASNLGKPLAFKPDHNFTKQLRSIVAYILDNDDFKEEEPKKKSLFGFLKKNK